MTERELKKLRSFLAEDGSRRYIREEFGGVYTLDEYGRELRFDCIDGYVRISFYDDEKGTVTVVDMSEIDGSFSKDIFELSPGERIENRLKELHGERKVSYSDNEFHQRRLIADETERIQAEVGEIRKKYPGEYLDFDDILSELGLH